MPGTGRGLGGVVDAEALVHIHQSPVQGQITSHTKSAIAPEEFSRKLKTVSGEL
ncbi:hypothetical protein ACWDA9_27870 [Streptomyces sp. NPDC001193]